MESLLQKGNEGLVVKGFDLRVVGFGYVGLRIHIPSSGFRTLVSSVRLLFDRRFREFRVRHMLEVPRLLNTKPPEFRVPRVEATQTSYRTLQAPT